MKLKVTDMNCNHCVAKISKAVLQAGVVAKVDLNTKTVDFANESQKDTVVNAIVDAGYHPEV